jgi:hypothetical protein
MFASSEHACDQWHSSRESTALTVVAMNYVETLKVYDLECRVLCAQRPDGFPLYQDMSGVQVSQLNFTACPSRTDDFTVCPNSKVFENLQNGVHKFQVRAIDAVGNMQVNLGLQGYEIGASTDYVWEVDQAAPTVRVLTHPGGQVDTPEFTGSITGAPAASFTFDADEPKASFQCRRCIFVRGEDEAEPWNALIGCSIFGACNGDGSTLWWNVWPTDSGAVAGMLPPHQDPVPVCAAAADAGCTPVDVHADASRATCADGFLRICEYTQFSYLTEATTPSLAARNCADPPGAPSLSRSEQLAAYACVGDELFQHVVTVRAKVRCAFSNRKLHSRMPLDPTHVRLKRTCVWPMAFLSGVHSSYRLALLYIPSKY